jgi:hypothetical protein
LRIGKRRSQPRAADVRGEQEPVGFAHREDLEARMDLLRMAVELEGACEFGDPPGRGEERREAFMAHFRELKAPLEEWNERVDGVRAAPAAVWGWYERAARKRGVSEPPFAVGALIDRLAILTAERSRQGELDVPRELQIERFRDRVSGVERVSLHMEGQNVARLPSEPSATIDQRAEAAEATLQKLFDDAQRSNEAQDVANARDALVALKQPLLERLAIHASVDDILFAPDCPVCLQAREEQYAAVREDLARGEGTSAGGDAG